MKAILFPGNKRVDVVDRPDPAPGFGEVLIRMRASALCRSDMSIYYGKPVVGGEAAKTGLVVPGHEPSGEVIGIGSGATGDQTIELMEQAGAKNIGLMFDTQHAYFRSEVPTDYVYRMGKNLRHLHLSELGQGAPGTGPGDFVGLVSALKEIGYDGYLAIEIGFNRRDVEPDHVARQAYEYMKPLVSE
jgi:xylose isomerase-like TIM barrel protein/alcohol dehydrogenase-like protein